MVWESLFFGADGSWSNVAMAPFESKFVWIEFGFSEKQDFVAISKRCIFKAETAKNKRNHISVIKMQKGAKLC